MPPHCDSLDGPVVAAARQALDVSDVDLVLPFVPEAGEEEVRAVFHAVAPVRRLGSDVKEVADRLFFETVVRVHRAGEGAPFNGLRPAGLDVGPVIPLAEKALACGSTDELADFLAGVLRQQLRRRLDGVRVLEPRHLPSVGDARAYVESVLGFEAYSHHLYQAMLHDAHHDTAEPAVRTHGG